MIELQPFQRRFLRNALAPGIDTAALSLPRGNGKTWLAAHILTRCMTPGDELHEAGAEYLLCAASIEQARICFRFVRAALEPTGEYRFLDSNTRIGIVHKPSNTRLRVMSSNGKTAMGIVGTPIAVADEPGSWELSGGQLMADALLEAQGKPNSPLRVILIGTLAPLATAEGHWWFDLVEAGTRKTTYVQALRADPAKWDDWKEIRRVNPLARVSAELRAKLRERLADAYRDSRLRARFLSYRLNIPSRDLSTVLLTAEDWLTVESRELPDRKGAPIVAVDMGQNRAWCAAVALWPSGRLEALAVAPGLPDLAEQEKRDLVPAGSYERLYDAGLLRIADGLNVPPAQMVIDAITDEWGKPQMVITDRARLADLKDAARGIKLVERVTRWFEGSADIRGLRKLALDGPLAVCPQSAPLLRESLRVATVKSDDAGNVRLVKRGFNNTARDDVAAALTLAAGELDRRRQRPTPGPLRAVTV